MPIADESFTQKVNVPRPTDACVLSTDFYRGVLMKRRLMWEKKKKKLLFFVNDDLP